MASFTIPHEVIPGFKTLMRLSESQVKILADALAAAPMGFGIKDFVEENLPLFPDLSFSDLGNLVASIFSTVNTFLKFKGSPDDFGTDFAMSVKSRADLNEVEYNDFKRNLLQLTASYPHLHRTMKARKALVANSMSFEKASVNTDLRVIFSDYSEATNEEEQASVIVHNLQIEYHTNGESKELFLSLDSYDLRTLRDVLTKAIEKDRALKSTQMHFNVLDIKP